MNKFLIFLIFLFLIIPFLYSKSNNKLITRKSWLYQLQDADINRIAESGFHLAVLDDTKDGISPYTKKDIQRLRKTRITVLAYISIGEAECFRSYWKEAWADYKKNNGEISSIQKMKSTAPGWLGRVPNPDWPESVKVRFWKEGWFAAAIKPALDKILQAGFQGAYLDIIDAYEYWGDPKSYGPDGEKRQPGDPVNEKEAALKMIAFVQKIAGYCRSMDKDFFVVPQNGAGIIDYDLNGAYLKTVSGIGAEDTWYDGTKLKPENEINEALRFLRKFKKSGKTVFSVDYIDNGTGYSGENKKRIENYISLCREEGFVYYAGRENRNLDSMNIIKGVQP